MFVLAEATVSKYLNSERSKDKELIIMKAMKIKGWVRAMETKAVADFRSFQAHLGTLGLSTLKLGLALDMRVRGAGAEFALNCCNLLDATPPTDRKFEGNAAVTDEEIFE